MNLKLFLALVKTIRRFPALQGAIWRVRKSFNRTKRWLLDRRPIVDATPLIRSAILEQRPLAAGKMGSTEANALLDFFKRRKALQTGNTPRAYRPYIDYTLFMNSGVFPQTPLFFDRFCESYLQAAGSCDVLVAWDVAGEAEILSTYCKDAALVAFDSLEPYLSSDPWTSALAGKKVLVISPFIESIQAQFTRRETLWDSPHILPPFTLLTLRAPLSAGLAQPQDADWFAALDRLEGEMDALDYDVALIGAGAFSLPLAVHAKKRGKIGIHLGGATQILFGIYGERWLHNPQMAGFIKETWVRPGKQETPQNFKANENGAYW